MRPDEIAEWHDGNRWHRIRVLVPLGMGVGGIVFAFRRLSDHQRVLVYRDGREMEVPG